MSETADLDDLWRRLEMQLKLHAPSLFDSLRPPASAIYLEACEKELGIRMPEDVRHAYLRHDGSAYPPAGWRNGPQPLGLMGRLRWLPLNELLEWRDAAGTLFDPDNPYLVQEAEWAGESVRPWDDVPPQWIPIASNLGVAVFWYIDMAPGPFGHQGQIVKYTTQGGTLSCWLVANSLSGYLRALTAGLEQEEIRPILADDGCTTIWQSVKIQREFEMPEHRHAFGFR